MDALLDHISITEKMDPDLLALFAEKWEHISVPKDYVLVRENSIADHLYFIEKGIARIYYNKNDKEVTEWIAMDQTFFLSIISFFERKPSKLIIHTIEEAEIRRISYDHLVQLANEHHAIERWFRKSLAGSLILSQKRMDALQFESAQHRYEILLNTNPGIIQRVPLSYIASWLGITQETLSRIRSTI